MEESNPWPTFVDAFSTVLCIFIFLMLVFVLNSMLIMYESSKKTYAAAAHMEQVAKAASSAHADDGGAAPDKQNQHDSTVATTSGTRQSMMAEAEQQQATAGAEMKKSAASSSTQTAQANAEGGELGGDKMLQGNVDESNKGQVIRLADNETAASIKGQNSGRFDSPNTPPAWEIKGNQFLVNFKGVEQGYPADVIQELNKWIGKNKPLSITVYARPTESIAVSDAMRLAYERGVILLKIIKEKHPNDEISISVVNDAAALNNSAVVTRSE